MTSAIQNMYSVKVNAAIDQYTQNIGSLLRTYQNIEKAKGRWHIYWENYRTSGFPSSDGFNQILDKELETYLNFAKATEQSKILLDLFQNTIDYCTRTNISATDYETLERRGYKVAPSLEGESLLPQIRSELEHLSHRIKIIHLHMVDRLPKAAVNLNGIFQEVFKHRQEATWTDTAKNLMLNQFLEKALEKRRNSEPSSEQLSMDISKELTIVESLETPEDELASLKAVLIKLQKLNSEDPLTTKTTNRPHKSTSTDNL